MTTETTTLTAWLMVQIAADEAVAKRAGSFTPWDLDFQNDNYGHLTVQPARVLATCAAHRAIVELHAPLVWGVMYCSQCGGDKGANTWPCPTLRALASIYKDAPGFDSRWVG